MYCRPFVGGDEYINGISRWLLLLKDADPQTLRAMPLVIERMQSVRDLRERSARTSTRAIADYPTRLNVEVFPDSPFLAIPEVSSERREYIPIGWLEPPTVPSNLLRLMLNAEPWRFAILTSRMHMSWIRYIGGRLKSDVRYSIGIGYNPFPWPTVSLRATTTLTKLAQNILDARASHSHSTLADLYDSVAMPPELRRAHNAVDRAVDALYRKQPFDSDRSRVEHLFGLYETMTEGLFAAPVARRRRAAR